MSLKSWMTVKGRASPWARWSSWETGSRSSRPEVPCGSASVATPAQLTWAQFLNTACPSVQEIWVRRPCPDLSSFSTHLHRGCSGKELCGELGVRRGWQPMDSQLSVCSLAKEAPSASPHLCPLTVTFESEQSWLWFNCSHFFVTPQLAVAQPQLVGSVCL